MENHVLSELIKGYIDQTIKKSKAFSFNVQNIGEYIYAKTFCADYLNSSFDNQPVRGYNI